MSGQTFSEADFVAHSGEHIVQLAHLHRKLPFFLVGVQDLDNAAAGHHDAEIGEQGNARVVGNEDKDFTVLAEQLQGACAMDSGILHFVQQDDGRIANDGSIGDEQGAGLTAGKLGHAAGEDDRLAGKLVGKRQRVGDHGFGLAFIHRADAGMCGQKFLHRQVGQEGGVLGDQGDGIAGRVIAVFERGAFAVDQDAAPGLGVAVGEQLDIVDERSLARAGRPDDADHVAHFEVDALHRFGLTGAAHPAQDGDILNSHLYTPLPIG